jgi:hypothetical protein
MTPEGIAYKFIQRVSSGKWNPGTLEHEMSADISAAIAAAVAAEREACAKVAEGYNGNFKGAMMASSEIAAAIRARGNGRE